METSLARRERRRRNGGPGRGRGTASKVAVAIPLFLFGTFLLVGMIGFVVAVSAYTEYSRACATRRPSTNIQFDQQTIVYDSTGKVELARFGQQKRIVVEFNDLPRRS